VRLLWLEGRTAQPLGDGAIVADENGQVLLVDGRLAVHRREIRVGGRAISAAAAAADGGIWAADESGSLLHIDSTGTILHEAAAPYVHPALAADAAGRSVWLTRSQRRFEFTLESQPAPVVWAVAAARGIGAPVVPEHVLLTELANAGTVAVGDGVVFYAPFIRDEVVALDSTGDTVWLLQRGLPHGTSRPHFEIVGGKPVIDYHPVNLGLALGPDGLVYVLSTPGRTTAIARLDVIDPARGRLLRSALLGTALPTIAADRSGRVYQLDADRLLRGTPPPARQPLPGFEVARLGGGRIGSDQLRGRVALINVWASWCAPCREEMPALDSLQRRLAAAGLVFVALNEDHDAGAARRFLRQAKVDMDVGLGRGRLARRLHYPGLPYTVLLDTRGAVVQRWVGFGGREQIAEIERLALRELQRHHIGHGDSR
jgi:thiol-disulfide isomerase/thioredoxin